MFKSIAIGFLTALFIIPLPAVSAEEKQAFVIENAVLFVDTVVNIDKQNRILTLANKKGMESIFFLGPEVQNFEQIKRGDRVLLSYFNAFAIALGPKNTGIKDYLDALERDTAKQDDTLDAKITRQNLVIGNIENIDQNNRVVTFKGMEETLLMSISENVDLSKISVGDEVEAIYIESYAIDVRPAPASLGAVSFDITSIAIGLGVEWGQGILTLYDGSTYSFDIDGISVIDVGVSLVKAEGAVYDLVEAKDIEGDYWVAEIGISYGNGVSALIMRNNNGVILLVTTEMKGIKLTLAAEGMAIKNVKPLE